MKRFAIGLTIAATVVGLSACGSTDPDVIVETDAGDVTKEDFYEAMKSQFGDQTLRELVTEKVLSDKYDVTDEEVEEEIESFKDELGEQFDMWMMQQGLQDEEQLEDMIKMSLLQEAAMTEDVDVSDEEIEEHYERMQTEIEAQHMLLDDEDEAEDVQQKLDEGEDFADLAEEYSVDEETAENGGDIGYFSVGEMDPNFEDAAYSMDVDDISDIVETDFGYHIIKVTDKRDVEDVEDLEDVEDSIKRQIAHEKIDQAEAQEKLDAVLEDANIDVKIKEFEDLFEPQEDMPTMEE